MRIPERFRSLRAYSILWIVLPVTLMMAGLIASGFITYRRAATSLLIEHHHQLASLAALSVSEVVDGYARILVALADNDHIRSDSKEERDLALKNAGAILDVFNAGVVIVDKNGETLSVSPGTESPIAQNVAGQDYFRQVEEQRAPVYSNTLASERDGADMVVVAVPILDQEGGFDGAVLGLVHLQTASLSSPVKNLIVSQDTLAYLIDRNGRVAYHPQAHVIGMDYRDRSYVNDVLAGGSGGILWTSPDGEKVVEGYAPVEATGWGLVVQNPWEGVIAPILFYGRLVMLAGGIAILVLLLLIWRSVRRLVAPVQMLAEQANQLASLENLAPVEESGIFEIDTLERAFENMAAQIDSYRAGLRRYVGAITQSQEDERRRIARELHDETIQSLLAISRRMELYQASETEPERLEQLAEMQSVVGDTLAGVRQISRDLRPLILEDLGLVPAIKALVQVSRRGEGAIPHARFEVSGEPVQLSIEQELALYRITQEALTNVRKHASPTGVMVDLTFTPSGVQLEISDDGTGFDVPANLAELAHQGSFGLMGIQERVWGVGGSLSIQSTPEQGTRLCVTIPVKVERKASDN